MRPTRLWWRFYHRYLPRNCLCYVSQYDFMLTIRTPAGYPLRAGRWPFGTLDVDGQRDQIWGALENLRMKRLSKKVKGDGRFEVADPELAEEYPYLYAFLTDRQYDADDGGGPRELGSLSLWASDGLLRAKLNAKDEASCCYVAGASLVDLLAAADAACSDADAGWKPDPNARPGQKKK